MMHSIRVTINGRLYEEDIEPRQMLVHFLRENIGLTGVHGLRYRRMRRLFDFARW
jgi:aerobic-type carbon monoxide dehydrogenase small subunit (CoxS/CutS family)